MVAGRFGVEASCELGERQRGCVRFVANRLFADPEAAARQLVQLAASIAVQASF